VTDGATKGTLLGERVAAVAQIAPPPVVQLHRPLAHVAEPQVERHCIAVIDGMHSKQECL